MAKSAPAKGPKAQETAVATIDENRSVAAAVPSFMQGYAGQGTENVTQEDIETPRIKLLQALSPECEEFDDAKAGCFWHTIAQQNLGTTLRVVPVFTDMRAILWNPRESGGGILARSDDLQTWSPPMGEFQVKINKGTKQVTWKLHKLVSASRLLEWGSSDVDDPNSPPAATKMYNVVVAMPDFPDLGPAVVTMQRSSVGVAKKFLSMLKLMNRTPSFGLRFQMAAVDDHNKNGDKFKNFQFAALGMVDNEEEFHRYRHMYETFKSMGLKVRDIDEDAVAEADKASPDKDGPSY